MNIASLSELRPFSSCSWAADSQSRSHSCVVREEKSGVPIWGDWDPLWLPRGQLISAPDKRIFPENHQLSAIDAGKPWEKTAATHHVARAHLPGRRVTTFADSFLKSPTDDIERPKKPCLEGRCAGDVCSTIMGSPTGWRKRNLTFRHERALQVRLLGKLRGIMPSSTTQISAYESSYVLG